MKIQGRLMQAHFLKIHQILAKKKNIMVEFFSKKVFSPLFPRGFVHLNRIRANEIQIEVSFVAINYLHLSNSNGVNLFIDSWRHFKI